LINPRHKTYARTRYPGSLNNRIPAVTASVKIASAALLKLVDCLSGKLEELNYEFEIHLFQELHLKIEGPGGMTDFISPPPRRPVNNEQV